MLLIILKQGDFLGEGFRNEHSVTRVMLLWAWIKKKKILRDLTFATQNLCWKHVKYCTKMAYIKHRDELIIAVKHL